MAAPKRRSGSQKRHRNEVVATRLTTAEYNAVRAHAQQRGQSVSDFIRGLILAACPQVTSCDVCHDRVGPDGPHVLCDRHIKTAPEPSWAPKHGPRCRCTPCRAAYADIERTAP